MSTRIFIIGVLVLFTACVQGEEYSSTERDESSVQGVEMGDDYALTTQIRGERFFTRKWTRPDIEKVASLSEGKNYTLFTPRPGEVSEDGRIYIYDYGDYTVKTFTRRGKYVTTYGYGRGQGPGEMTMMTDVGVWRDSLVYVVDPRQSRVSFFDENGEFVWSELYETRVARLALTEDSTAFEATPPSVPSFMTITFPSGRQTVISQLFSRDVHPIMLDGSFHTLNNRLLYVPLYFPILLSFSAEDTVGIAHPTPDYGQPRPRPQTRNEENQVSAPSTRFHWRVTHQDSVLSVEIPNSNVDSLQFDLYDTREMEYMHSVRLPIDESGAHYAYGTGTLVTHEDASINIYEVQTSK